MNTPRSKAAGFRALASEFHGKATTAKTLEERLRMLEMASRYLELARVIEDHESAKAQAVPPGPQGSDGVP